MSTEKKEEKKHIPKWKSHAEHYREALVYMKKGMEGKNQTFKTPWPKINDAGVKGWEFHSINIIGSRPGGGKTLSKDQIVRQAFAPENLDLNMRVLDFSLEMLGKNSKIREFSAVTKKTYKYLCSAEREGVTLTPELFALCEEHAAKAARFPIDIVDVPLTVKEFRTEIIAYMKAHQEIQEVIINNQKTTRVVYRNTLITLDHSVLLKKAAGQSTMDMLNELGETLTELKKAFPIIFVILSQLNRSITTPARCENGKYGNYPNDEDIFGADALLQHADFLMIWDRPALRHITAYGPEKYIIEDDSVLVAHILKTRTGDTRMSFFKAVFEHMTIEEAVTPGTEGIKTN